jgi:hypothetical protein
MPERRPPDAGTQLLLALAYRVTPRAPRSLREVGFSCFSQTDEDGILLYLFAVLGTTNRLCVEICAGDGIECNTANLIVNHGWHGLLVDGARENVDRAARFYAEQPETRIHPPRLAQAWVTRDGVDELVRGNGFEGEIDLLSLDLDGVDYWIWEALGAVSPRVVVAEYQDILGPDRSWTVPYADDFDASRYPMTDGMPNFAGASLRAFAKLAARKGYRLVGVNRYGFNAFFVRDDVAGEIVPAVEVADCFSHPKVVEGMATRFPTVADLPWVEV